MSVRRDYVLEDTQNIIYEMLSKLTTTTSPWTAWDIVKGTPTTDVYDHLDKLKIYLDDPVVQMSYNQMGGKRAFIINLIIGIWSDENVGGHEEARIAASKILDLFTDPAKVRAVTFNITIGSTTYSNKNVYDLYVPPREVSNFRSVETEDIKQTRMEAELILKTGA
jgi:hypothetical protein